MEPIGAEQDSLSGPQHLGAKDVDGHMRLRADPAGEHVADGAGERNGQILAAVHPALCDQRVILGDCGRHAVSNEVRARVANIGDVDGQRVLIDQRGHQGGGHHAPDTAVSVHAESVHAVVGEGKCIRERSRRVLPRPVNEMVDDAPGGHPTGPFAVRPPADTVGHNPH